MSTNKYNIGADKIQYQITRPSVPVVDTDGMGTYNISPIGFPVRDYAAEIDVDPTLITPTFIIPYNNPVTGSARISIVYYVLNTNVETFADLQSFIEPIDTITYITTTATATTVNKHGYTSGITVTIAGATESVYNGTFTIVVTGEYSFIYTMSGAPTANANGILTSEYTMTENAYVALDSQTNSAENGVYRVHSGLWQLIVLDDSVNVDVKASTTANAPVTVGGLTPIVYTIESISSDGTTATVTTTELSTQSIGNSIVIASTTNYNGTYTVTWASGYVFKFALGTGFATETSGTATYQPLENEVINVNAQTDPNENAVYIAHDIVPWELIGFFYKWDGTEADNSEGNYASYTEPDGTVVTPNHYRWGYSHEEVTDYLRSRLQPAINFGKFAGSNRPASEQGALFNWMSGGGRINIGGSGTDHQVWIPAFGFGNANQVLAEERSQGPTDPTDYDAVAYARTEISRLNRPTWWGLTNHHTESYLVDGSTKAPHVRDYPFAYNSEYDEVVGIGSGGMSEASVDEMRLFAMGYTGSTGATGATGPTGAYARPFSESVPFYQRDNAYHNNITLDMTLLSMYGRHNISINNRYDRPDEIVYATQYFGDSALNVVPAGVSDFTLPSTTNIINGHYCQFSSTGTLPTGLSDDTTYRIKSVSGNVVTVENLDGSVVTITAASGGGSHKIQTLAYDPRSYVDVISALDGIINSETTVSGYKTLIKDVQTDYVAYYHKKRSKGSVTAINLKGSSPWLHDELTYDLNGTNGIDVYLLPNEQDYVTFVHPIWDASEIITFLLDNNDMIPVMFDPNTPAEDLDQLYVYNALYDNTNSANLTGKIRSKKTFVHLPISNTLADGTTCEFDVSLPVIPDTDSFGLNTIGSLSGYRNVVSQPRVYFLSGHQDISCDDVPVPTYTYDEDRLGVLEFIDPIDYYVETFASSAVDLDFDCIHVDDIDQWSVGDLIQFDTETLLPTGLSIGVDYEVERMEDVGGIVLRTADTLTHVTLSSQGTGPHYVIRNDGLKFRIKGATNDEFNIDYYGTVKNRYEIRMQSPIASLSGTSTVDGNLFIDKVVLSNGTSQKAGLTERNNEAIFGVIPEEQFPTATNAYHQEFTPDSLNSTDKRVLLASIYPTTSNTFAWRIDNDPHLRMLKWSMLNVTACGGDSVTGSFANVAYKRNQSIHDDPRFTGVFDFSVWDNPLSYNTTTTPDFTQQQINAFVRIYWPEKLVPDVGDDLVPTEYADNVAVYEYQASTAFKDLMADFQKGRVAIMSGPIDDAAMQSSRVGYDGNNTNTSMPSNFYTGFIQYNTYETANISPSSDLNGFRWMTKALYVPDYVVNAEGYTNDTWQDSFKNTDPAFKSYISQYFVTDLPRETNAGNRYVPTELNPLVDPSYEFAVGNENKFIDYLILKGTDSVELNDIRRAFWDSAYEIDSDDMRKMQNMYQVGSYTSGGLENEIRFNGAGWIPFAKVFSTDNIAPAEHEFGDIEDYSYLKTNFTYADDTFSESFSSNPFALRNHLYSTLETTRRISNINSLVIAAEGDDNNQEFIRNYVVGYSNKMPLRFYNGFRVVVYGDESSTGQNEPINADRIFDYTASTFSSQYLETPPSAQIGQYIDDNYLFIDDNSANVTVNDFNSAWVRFDEIDSTISEFTDMLTVSGMNYLATREFYQNKMEYNYIRYKLKFVFSAQIGRWMVLDYRQVPTSFLTPTFGNVALSKREKSTTYAEEPSVFVPIVINNINTIDAGTYPLNEQQGDFNLDYLWKSDVCDDPMNIQRLLAKPYYLQTPMKLNPSCYPFLTDVFPYDSDGNLVSELDPSTDSAGAESYRFTKLIEPNKSIDFVVPNNVFGGKTDPDTDLFLYQPHMWDVYWHMRPAVCAMDGTDIPHGLDRTGGVMADPVLNDMFIWPNPRSLEYRVPWHEDMDTDWLDPDMLIIDAEIVDELGDPDRDCGYEIIDAEIVDVGGDPDRDDYDTFESERS